MPGNAGAAANVGVILTRIGGKVKGISRAVCGGFVGDSGIGVGRALHRPLTEFILGSIHSRQGKSIMTTQVKTPPKAPEIRVTARKNRKFTVAEYYRMAEVGILHTGERVELIDGVIVEMAPIGKAHASGVKKANRLFSQGLERQITVGVQDPVDLGTYAELQPDLSILRFREDAYARFHPRPEDILLIIEVSDSTLAHDREVKVAIYGRAGVPETWIVNLAEDSLERFWEPGPEGYARRSIHRRGEKISPIALPDLEVAVEDLLPPLEG